LPEQSADNGRKEVAASWRTLTNEPIIRYSLSPSILFYCLFSSLLAAAGEYELYIGQTPISWALIPFCLGEAYFRLWRRPIRRAKFYEDHLELDGYGTNFVGAYSSVSGLVSYRQFIGDIRTDRRVSFFVKDRDVVFVLPERRNRKLNLDIYSLIKQKSPSSVKVDAN